MDINFEYYRVFYYVVKCRNFTQAASILMNSQPNITRIIRNLENALGCPLFLRSNRGVSLTPEGQKLYTHVKIAVEQIAEGEEELRQMIHLQHSTLSIGASEVALRCFLLPILKEYQKNFPHVQLKVFNYTTPQAVSALRSGTVDIAFMITPEQKHKDLIMTPIRKIQEVPVCGCAFSHLAEKKLSLANLNNYPIVSLGEQTQTYSFYTDFFGKGGLIFSPDIEVATADQILPMVKNNLGIGFVPEDFLDDDESTDLCRLHLSTPIPARTICCMELSGMPLSIAAKELKKMVFSRISG